LKLFENVTGVQFLSTVYVQHIQYTVKINSHMVVSAYCIYSYRVCCHLCSFVSK